jgi:hypothetical protein
MWQGGGLRGDGFQCAASTASTDAGIYGFAGLAADILVNALPVDHAGSANEVTLDFAGANQFVEDSSVDAAVCDSRGDFQETGKDLHLSGGGCLKGGFFFVTEHVVIRCGNSIQFSLDGALPITMLSDSSSLPAYKVLSKSL